MGTRLSTFGLLASASHGNPSRVGIDKQSVASIAVVTFARDQVTIQACHSKSKSRFQMSILTKSRGEHLHDVGQRLPKYLNFAELMS